MRRTRLLTLALALLADPVGAEPSPRLQALTERTLEALATDPGAAIAPATEAEALARALPDPDPSQYAFALNNLAYALILTGNDPDRAEALLTEAMQHMETRDRRTSAAWLTAAGNLTLLAAQQGDAPLVLARADGMARVARGTEFAAPVLAAAATQLFTVGTYPDFLRYLQELLATEPGFLSQGYANVSGACQQAKDPAEAEGRMRDVIALNECQIAIYQTYLPEMTKDAVHDLRFQIFNALYRGGAYGEAAGAYTAWVQGGTPTEEEAAFIDAMARDFLTLTQYGFYTEDRTVQLGRAELSVALAEALPDPADLRRGDALRELAAALGALGRHDAAGIALQRAAEVYARSDRGRLVLHLVLDDLAGNALMHGDPSLAQELYGQADAAYAAALAAGGEPLGGVDIAITLKGRAGLLTDQERPEMALDLLDDAARAIAEEAARRDLNWNDKVEGARIEAEVARALAALGQGAEAQAHQARAVDTARAAFPADHPGFAVMLTNAADLFGVLGNRDAMRRHAAEALAIQRRVLTEDDPQRLATEEKLLIDELLRGERAAATDRLRRIVAGRKAPANRDTLADARQDFEWLAWLLLDGTSPDRARLDEAFEALQWTQITRSARAVAALETRLAHESAGLGSVLRQRQDLLEQRGRARSSLLAAFAGGTAPGAPLLAALHRRIDALDADLSRVEADLAAAGFDTGTLGQVRPMALAEAQAQLAPGETLVTFALPGLRAEVVPGLDSSSNKAIAITRDSVTVAPVAEDSIGELRARIRTFRCSVSISDRGCEGGGAAGLRGAMILTRKPDPAAFFDLAPAQALYADLFGGLAEVLAGTDHLVVAPPVELLDLPFQALVTGPGDDTGLRDVPWMIRDHAISVLPSVPALRVLAGTEGAGTRLLGIGDPKIGLGGPMDCAAMDLAALRSAAPDDEVMQPAPDPSSGLRLADPAALRRLSRLPDATCELRAIAGRFAPGDSTLLLDTEASEAAIKQLNRAGQLQDFDVLVFSTHGLVAGEAGAAAPGLVLTPPEVATPEDDGLLTAAEIATLRLNARMVVLSACNTAAGEGEGAEGLSGLARAFLHAGARAVMVTQWAVYSEASVEVSAGLFKARAEAGLDGAAALRAATLAILEAPDTPAFKRHPAYWAPFTMIGAR